LAYGAYADGAFDRAITTLTDAISSPARVSAFRRDLQRHPPDWRDQIVAALALEAASIALPIVSHDLKFSGELTRLLEIGCANLRRSPPDLFEREWHLAVLAFLTGPGADRLGGRAESFPWPDSILEGHLTHVWERVPNDPEIAYALGVVKEGAFHTWYRTWGMSLRRPGAQSPTPATADDLLRDAAQRFEDARSSPALRGEATLRLGAVRLYQGRVDEAMTLWSELPNLTGVSSVLYLAHVFRARVLTDSNRITEGEAAYRTALSIRPAAQSALVPLAALRFLEGDDREVSALVESLVTGQTDLDPMRTYLEPGHDEWPRRLTAVREAAVR
jgi:hypothetical protein